MSAPAWDRRRRRVRARAAWHRLRRHHPHLLTWRQLDRLDG